MVPLVVGALEHNAKHHWNPAVHSLTLNVRKMLQELDAPLYERCRQQWEAQQGRTPAGERLGLFFFGGVFNVCCGESVDPSLAGLACLRNAPSPAHPVPAARRTEAG